MLPPALELHPAVKAILALYWPIVVPLLFVLIAGVLLLRRRLRRRRATARADMTSPLAVAGPRQASVPLPPLAAIEANRDLVIAEFSKLADRPIGFDRASVEWVEGFLERRRGNTDEAMSRKLVSTIGSYLGEAIRAHTGGEWAEISDRGLGLRFPNGNICFPFSKVEKQLAEGVAAGESIASFYNVCIDMLAKDGFDAAAKGEGS